MGIRDKFKNLRRIAEIFQNQGAEAVCHHLGLTLDKDAVFHQEIQIVVRTGLLDFTPDPQVEPVPNTDQVDINIAVDEGPRFFVRRIDFSGNSTDAAVNLKSSGCVTGCNIAVVCTPSNEGFRGRVAAA